MGNINTEDTKKSVILRTQYNQSRFPGGNSAVIHQHMLQYLAEKHIIGQCFH